MWSRAEGVALLDEDGIVRAVSRNEDEARIRHVIGTKVIEERAIEVDKPKAIEAFQAALEGKETELELGAIADYGQVIWGRIVLKPSPLPETPVLLHSRSLSWLRKKESCCSQASLVGSSHFHTPMVHERKSVTSRMPTPSSTTYVESTVSSQRCFVSPQCLSRQWPRCFSSDC